MKEYRLTAWPELAPPFHRTAYRRMASDMSHRFMTLPQLADLSGLKRLEVRHFIDMLEGRGLLIERESLAPIRSRRSDWTLLIRLRFDSEADAIRYVRFLDKTEQA